MQSVTINVKQDVEAERALDLLMSLEEIEEMKVTEVKRRLKEQALATTGTKAELVQRLFESQDESGGGVARGRHCTQCQRWWHARCVPKDLLQRELREPDAPFLCPYCAGFMAARGHEAGRVRYNALPHQILIPLSSAYSRLFEGKEADGEDDDRHGGDGDVDNNRSAPGTRNAEMAQQLQRFRAMHAEVGAIHDAHRTVYSYMSSLNELSSAKARLRFPRDGEVVDDEDVPFVVYPAELAQRRAQVEKEIADADEDRKQALRCGVRCLVFLFDD